MAIYELDGSFTISAYQQWRPGVYDTERTARYAQRFTDDDLRRLQDSVNPGGVITYEMLKALSANKTAAAPGGGRERGGRGIGLSAGIP